MGHKNNPPCKTCKWGIDNAPPLGSLAEEIFEVFVRVSGQVRVGGMGSAYALDYNVIFPVLESYGIPKDEWWIFLEGIRICEKYLIKSMERHQEKQMKSKEGQKGLYVKGDQSRSIGLGRGRPL